MNEPVPRRHVRVEHVMGMPVSAHVRALPWVPSDQVEGALDAVMGHLRHVDALFSTYQEDSQLMRLRRHEIEAAAAHPWLAEVEDLVELAAGLTDGLFSGRWSGDYDPTGLVKGWAAQGATDHLSILPGVSFCLNAGGDLAVGVGPGVADGVSPWRVGIEEPRARGRVARVVTLSRGAVATSGAATRGGHVVDPRTDRPVVREGSTTVLGPDLLWADVWATAAFVDPELAGRLLAARAPDYRLIEL